MLNDFISGWTIKEIWHKRRMLQRLWITSKRHEITCLKVKLFNKTLIENFVVYLVVIYFSNYLTWSTRHQFPNGNTRVLTLFDSFHIIFLIWNYDLNMVLTWRGMFVIDFA